MQSTGSARKCVQSEGLFVGCGMLLVFLCIVCRNLGYTRCTVKCWSIGVLVVVLVALALRKSPPEDIV